MIIIIIIIIISIVNMLLYPNSCRYQRRAINFLYCMHYWAYSRQFGSGLQMLFIYQ